MGFLESEDFTLVLLVCRIFVDFFEEKRMCVVVSMNGMDRDACEIL